MLTVIYILKKLGYGILVLLLVVSLISAIILSGEVDPTQLQYGQRVSEKTLESQKKELGLDLPLHTQIFRYIQQLSPISVESSQNLGKYKVASQIPFGQKYLVLKAPYFGKSYQNGRSVWELIAEAIPSTIILAFSSFLLAIIIGIPLGMAAAYYFESPFDRMIVALSTLGYSLPSYVVAIILAIIFAYYLFPVTRLNLQGGIWEVNDIGDDVLMLKNLLLPAIALGIRPLAVVTQITRSSTLDIKDQLFVQTAKAKGISDVALWTKHIFRNSLTPLVTALSGWLASLLAGAFFVETVFNFRGLGSLTVNALLNYDVPLLLGCIIVTSIIFIMINILTDLLYIWIDPKQEIT